MDTIVTPASVQQLARLEELLRRAGIGAKEIQALIDDVSLRNMVAQVWRYGDDIPEVELPAEFDKAAMKRFIAHVFSQQIQNLGWFQDRPGYEMVGDGFDPEELASTTRVKELLKGLDTAYVAVAVFRSGLIDGQELSAAEVAARLDLTVGQVAKMRAAVTAHVRARQQSVFPFKHYTRINQPVTGDSIDSLKLSVRAYSALMRGNIRTVDQLTAMSVEDLYDVRNVGTRVFEEIWAALAERGLSLA